MNWSYWECSLASSGCVWPYAGTCCPEIIAVMYSGRSRSMYQDIQSDPIRRACILRAVSGPHSRKEHRLSDSVQFCVEIPAICKRTGYIHIRRISCAAFFRESGKFPSSRQMKAHWTWIIYTFSRCFIIKIRYVASGIPQVDVVVVHP